MMTENCQNVKTPISPKILFGILVLSLGYFPGQDDYK